MLADISYYVTLVSYLVAIGILSLGTYRAFKIRRVLAQPIYRSRALGLALVAFLYIVVLVTDLVPYPNQTDLVTATLITLTFNLPYLVFAFMMFVSVDRTILVAIDMDLFRRNTLRWPGLRLPLYALVLGSFALVLVANPFLFLQNPPLWATVADLAFYPLFLIPFGISAVALALSARRSLEKTMGRFVALLGVSVAFFITDSILFNYVYYFYYTPALQFADNLVIIAATYFLYRAITSLTPLGKVELPGAAQLVASGDSWPQSGERRPPQVVGVPNY